MQKMTNTGAEITRAKGSENKGLTKRHYDTNHIISTKKN